MIVKVDNPGPVPPWLRNDFHVVPLQNHWAVKLEGIDEYARIEKTQFEAIATAARMARDGAGLLVIHGRDGRFREVRSYR